MLCPIHDAFWFFYSFMCDICSGFVYSFVKALASLTIILLTTNFALDHINNVIWFARRGCFPNLVIGKCKSGWTARCFDLSAAMLCLLAPLIIVCNFGQVCHHHSHLWYGELPAPPSSYTLTVVTQLDEIVIIFTKRNRK